MRRGDIVVVAVAGDYGKPRPAVVVQSDQLDATGSVLVALMSSVVLDAPISRILIEPSELNGLRVPSQIMVEKITVVPRRKCSPAIGRLDGEQMLALNHTLSFVVGLAD